MKSVLLSLKAFFSNSQIKFLAFFISGTVKATITAAVGELIFLKTQEMVNNLLKIGYFHLKTLLCIHYLCTSISAKF